MHYQILHHKISIATEDPPNLIQCIFFFFRTMPVDLPAYVVQQLSAKMAEFRTHPQQAGRYQKAAAKEVFESIMHQFPLQQLEDAACMFYIPLFKCVISFLPQTIWPGNSKEILPRCCRGNSLQLPG